MKTDLILSKLLDKYEKSKTFSAENKVNQTFKVSIIKVFPQYEDDSKPAFFKQINEDLNQFVKKDFISLNYKHGNIVDEVILNVDSIDKIYTYLNRTSRKNEQQNLRLLLSKYKKNEESPLQDFIIEQEKRLSSNKNIEHFTGDFEEFEDVLKAVECVQVNNKETFIRDLSVQLFNNSKRFEKIQSKICSILIDYGEYDNSENILAEYDIVKTPTYVCIKGKGEIKIASELLNLSNFSGDIAFSTETLKEITSIQVKAEKVITIENLTTFHDFEDNNAFIIYLGGFHNQVKRDFLKLIYKQNPEKEYLHFGDIDAGGFYIYEHLKSKTDIPFKTLQMDIITLEKYKEYWINLTQNDRKRLQFLSNKTPLYSDVLKYMIENNCKLEQEAENCKENKNHFDKS